MFGETTISYVKVVNHSFERTIYKWLALGFQVYITCFNGSIPRPLSTSHVFQDAAICLQRCGRKSESRSLGEANSGDPVGNEKHKNPAPPPKKKKTHLEAKT